MIKKVDLPGVIYEFTTKCNLKCKYCYNHWKKDDLSNFINDVEKYNPKKTLKKWFKVVKTDEITFSGGEPTTNYEELYNFLKLMGLKFIEEDMNTKTLKGLKFALTGEGPLKRSEIQKLIENLGGEVKGISKDVNYLVTNDPESKSGKMKQAEKFKVEVINYEKLFQTFLGE